MQGFRTAFAAFAVLLIVFSCLAYTTIMETGFESGGLTGWWNGEGRGEIISTNAHSGSNCMKYTPCGACHVGITGISPTFREAYIEFWFRFEGGIPCSGSGCTTDGKHFWRLCSWPNKNVGIGPQLDTGLRNSTYGLWFFIPQSTSYGYNVDFPATQGVWYKQVMRIKLQEGSQPNGHFVVELDGSRIVDAHNISLGDTWDGGFDTWMYTNYDGITGYWLTDDMKFYVGPGSYDYDDGSGQTSPSITTLELPDGQQGVPYSFQLQVEGGLAPYTWDIVSGGLHPGLSLDTATGLISGTPEISQLRKIKFQLWDAKNPPATVLRELRLNVTPAGSISPIATQSGSELGFGIAHAGKQTIRFSAWLDKPGGLSIRVHDVNGRTVWSQSSSDLSTGLQQMAWDHTANQAGIYTATIRTQSEQEAFRFVVTD